jgi:hypothetical protein
LADFFANCPPESANLLTDLKINGKNEIENLEELKILIASLQQLQPNLVRLWLNIEGIEVDSEFVSCLKSWKKLEKITWNVKSKEKVLKIEGFDSLKYLLIFTNFDQVFELDLNLQKLEFLSLDNRISLCPNSILPKINEFRFLVFEIETLKEEMENFVPTFVLDFPSLDSCNLM